MSGNLMAAMPRQAAMAISDLLDNCAEVKAGQQVIIVAAFDGLAGGANLLRYLDHPKAAAADPKEFFDNSLINEISR